MTRPGKPEIEKENNPPWKTSNSSRIEGPRKKTKPIFIPEEEAETWMLPPFLPSYPTPSRSFWGRGTLAWELFLTLRKRGFHFQSRRSGPRQPKPPAAVGAGLTKTACCGAWGRLPNTGRGGGLQAGGSSDPGTGPGRFRVGQAWSRHPVRAEECGLSVRASTCPHVPTSFP